MRELYSKLGFTEEESRLQGDEFQKLCKKKFRELSKEWHPDRWSNKSEEERKKAEEKFKEINEANEILSDPEKRRVYDMTGSTNGQFQGGGGAEYDDPFEAFTNSMFGQRRQRVSRGSDIQVNVTITMKEAFTGTKKTISVPYEVKCSHCNGTGSADSKTTECPHCHGTGFIAKIQIMGNARFENRSTCPYCHGSGRIITKPCSYCQGSGIEMKNIQKVIEIPAGVFNGAVMSLAGEGNAPENNNGINGDLYIKFNVMPDPNYERRDNDIIFNLGLTLLEAWQGCKKDVYSIDGRHYIITVPELTKEGKLLKIGNGGGFVNVNSPFFDRGEFYAKIVYKMPRRLTKEQTKLLEDFYNLENKK